MQDKPDRGEAAQLAEAPKQQMRIVSFYGDWICKCGRQNRLWDHCQCTQVVPCRDWVRGRCKYMDQCRSVPCPPGHHVAAGPAARFLSTCTSKSQRSALYWISRPTQRWANYGLPPCCSTDRLVYGIQLAPC